MSGPVLHAQPAVLLPPLPRARDWPLAGLGAGLLLGAAELVGFQLAGLEVRPALGALVVAGGALAVALLATALGAAAELTGRRPSHSALVGALVGALLLAPGLGPLLGSFATAPPEPALLARLGGGSLVAGVAGLAAALGGERLERSGLPLPALPVWLSCACLVAAGESLRLEGPGLASGALVGLALGVGVIAAGVSAMHGRRGAWSWSATGTLAAALAAAAVAAPRALPWLLLDKEVPALAWGPPSVLQIDLGLMAEPDALVGTGEGLSYAQLALLASEGIRYESVPGGEAEEGLQLRTRRGLAEALAEQGYATAHLGAGTLRGPEAQRAYAALAATTGGGLLVRLAPGLLWRAGLPGAQPGAARLTAEARHWLLRWRTLRAPAPFLLVVDYNGVKAGDTEQLDRELGRLLAELEKLGVDEHTLVIAALRRALGEARLPWWIVRPPRGRESERVARGLRRVPAPVDAREFAAALLAAAQSPPDAPIALPGLRAPARPTGAEASPGDAR